MCRLGSDRSEAVLLQDRELRNPIEVALMVEGTPKGDLQHPYRLILEKHQAFCCLTPILHSSHVFRVVQALTQAFSFEQDVIMHTV